MSQQNETRGGEGLWEQTYIRILTPEHASCVTLGKLAISEPWVLHLLSGGKNFQLKELFEKKLK